MAGVNWTTIFGFSQSSQVALEEILLKGATSLLIIILGIVLGKLIGRGLEKLFEQIELHNKIRKSFVDLFVVIAKWSIYIIFIIVGLRQLEIPGVTNIIVKILINIPAFVASLVLIAVGFAVASYLRGIIEDAKMNNWEVLSKLVFYFVVYVFGVYALRVALISFKEVTVTWIIVGITIISAATIGYITARSSLPRTSSPAEQD